MSDFLYNSADQIATQTLPEFTVSAPALDVEENTKKPLSKNVWVLALLAFVLYAFGGKKPKVKLRRRRIKPVYKRGYKSRSYTSSRTSRGRKRRGY